MSKPTTPEERERQRQLAAEREKLAEFRKASNAAWSRLHPQAFRAGRHIEIRKKAAPEDGLVRSEAADLVGGANMEAAE